MLKGLARSGFGLIPACLFLMVNRHLFNKGLRKTYCGLFNHLQALRREGATGACAVGESLPGSALVL